MTRKAFIFLVYICFSMYTKAQSPVFGTEKLVSINGYSLDAMEPYLSPDGNALFFNSLNDGIHTSLYYAARVNDTTFNFVGLVPAVNQTVTPHLDGVASVDTTNHFYWVSTRDYPSSYENLQRVTFLSSSYTNFGPVHGDIYITSPGWLIMDACVDVAGNTLYYSNAYFNNCSNGLPCKAVLNVAQKANDSTFYKVSNSAALLSAINDTANYLVYAPQPSKNGLELYYTRLLKNGAQTEVCVAVRSNTASAFGSPTVLIGAPNTIPEAPTLSPDQAKLYYHKKNGSTYAIYMRTRNNVTGIMEATERMPVALYPNPATHMLHIDSQHPVETSLLNTLGDVILRTTSADIPLAGCPAGIYTVMLRSDNATVYKKIIIEK